MTPKQQRSRSGGMTEARRRAAIAASYLELAEVAAAQDGPASTPPSATRSSQASLPGTRSAWQRSVNATPDRTTTQPPTSSNASTLHSAAGSAASSD